MLPIVITVVLFLIGAAAGYSWYIWRSKQLVRLTRQKSEAILAKAKTDAEELLVDARKEISEGSSRQAEDLLIQEESVKRLEERVTHVEDQARRRLQSAQSKKANVEQMEQELQGIRDDIASLRKQEIDGLSKVCGVPVEHAMETVLQQITDELENEKFERIHRTTEFLEEASEEKAKAIILSALQRYSLPASRDSKAMFVDLSDKKVRERLIDKDNLNITRLQELTEVEIEIDNEEQVLLIHNFDLLKRSIAKMAIGWALNKRGAITPTDIEEGVKASSTRINSIMDDLGKETLRELEIFDLDPRMIRLVGRLAYRTSFGQNILSHSTEVACFSAILAGEIGADVKLCKRAGLMHDMGKGIDADVEGPHDVLSRDIGVKLQMDPIIIHAAYAHHEQADYVLPEDRLVQTADALSASRPGARQEATEKYIERIQELELIASSMAGVSKAYAIQAGREVRVIVEPDEVSDEEAERIAKAIAKEVQEKLTYPGEVMVNVIRETTAVDYAR